MKNSFLLLMLTLSLCASSPTPKDKLILVYIEMQHCGWCKKMDREIMDNTPAQEQLAQGYHIARIVKERGNIPSFLHPAIFPTTYILSPDGTKVIDKIEGYIQKSRFVNYLLELYEVESQ